MPERAPARASVIVADRERMGGIGEDSEEKNGIAVLLGFL
jgi:hypothetical protein